MTPEPQLEEEQTSRRVPLTIIGWGALLGVLLLVIVVVAHLLVQLTLVEGGLLPHKASSTLTVVGG